MTPDELDKYCEDIYGFPRINEDTVVILCEGRQIKARELEGYGNLDRYPDAYFYKHCVPLWWIQYPLPRPVFFNCGGRTDVIKTYFRLLELHQQPRTDSFLDVNKLFAIVDLDVEPVSCADYPFADTEAIYHHLYQHFRVNPENAIQHRIWVTGLVHKESYFLIPELQELFDNYPKKFKFGNESSNLQKLYRQMANNLENPSLSKEYNLLSQHFQSIKRRTEHLTALDSSTLTTWQQSWLKAFEEAIPDPSKYHELVYALLTIRNAKTYWEELTLDSEKPMESRKKCDKLRYELSIKIADFYARAENSCQFHIPCFLKSIYDVVY